MIESPAEILSHAAGPQAADSFTAWRKRIKKPLTETAALRIAKTLAEINSAGGNAADALGMAEERGWQTIKSEWYFKDAANGNANRATGGMASADTADRQITFAASFARAPGRDCF